MNNEGKKIYFQLTSKKKFKLIKEIRAKASSLSFNRFND